MSDREDDSGVIIDLLREIRDLLNDILVSLKDQEAERKSKGTK